MSNPLSRREVLKATAAMAGLATGSTMVSPSLAASNKASARERIKLNSGLSPMNAANLTPAFESVLQAQKIYAEQLNRDVSFIARRDFIKDKLESAREALADFLGVSDPDDIALLRNTSEANAIVINGFDLGPEDEVLVWHENHASNRDSWRFRQQRQHFRYREWNPPGPEASEQDIAASLREALNPATRVVSFSELSNISGRRLPAQRLCQVVHDYRSDIFVHVDGAQSMGNFPVDLAAMGCDSYASSCHKWLMGPRGTGLLYVRDKWAAKLWPGIIAYSPLFDYPHEHLPDTARRFDCLGQRDIAAFAAISETLEEWDQLGGITATDQRIRSLTRHLLHRLEDAGLKSLPTGANGGNGIVLIDLDDSLNVYGAFLALHNAGIASAFVSGSRVCCAPGQAASDDLPSYLRLSPHCYNQPEELDRAVEVIQRIANSRFEILKEGLRFL